MAFEKRNTGGEEVALFYRRSPRNRVSRLPFSENRNQRPSKNFVIFLKKGLPFYQKAAILTSFSPMKEGARLKTALRLLFFSGNGVNAIGSHLSFRWSLRRRPPFKNFLFFLKKGFTAG